ncbi:MAG TPA: D-alanine--D-alanine ligase family protein [Gaiellaceae bacterium]|nr:D-alanine--D-alanine ligase family protein [Gaiellaceae bacterium]
MRKLRVAVLMGGRSSEHDVSLDSARSVLAGLDPARYEVVPVEIGTDGRWQLPAAEAPGELEPGAAAGPVPLPVPVGAGGDVQSLAGVDVVFPVLHGPFGEDGTVQGLLELAGVAYVGAGVAASALCMDKDLFKSVMRDKGVPVARSVTARAGEAVASPFGFPCVVKPARLGSSVGISVVRREEDLAPAVELAFAHDEKILVEEFLDGVEVECSVLGNEDPIASVPGEIVPLASDWYDYEAKYADGGMELVVPPRVPPASAERVRELAVAAFTASECEGMARVDCFVRPDGEVVVNELNTIPGFTATSVYAKLFEASGIPYPELLDRLVELALARRDRRAALRF